MKMAMAMALALTAGAAIGSVSYTGGTITENFDSLANSGTANPWANNGSLAGWYAFNAEGNGSGNTDRDTNPYVAVPTYRADTGASTAGALYSFGASGSTERALGSQGANARGDYVWALVLQNNTGGVLNQFTLNYRGEQWRIGGQTAGFGQDFHTVDFDFAVVSTFSPAVIAANNTAGYNLTGPSAFDFTSLFGQGQDGAGTSGGARNGNAAAYSTSIGGTQSLTWNAGEFLVLRWWDNNNPGNDHGLAIDDVSFSAIPAPGALALAGLAGVVAGRRRRA